MLPAVAVVGMSALVAGKTQVLVVILARTGSATVLARVVARNAVPHYERHGRDAQGSGAPVRRRRCSGVFPLPGKNNDPDCVDVSVCLSK